MFGGRVFQQTIGTPMGTSCGPILAESVVLAELTWLVVTENSCHKLFKRQYQTRKVSGHVFVC